MIIDDDGDGSGYLARLLRHTGHDTVVHHCGEDGLEAMAANPPTLIILDIDMPGMSGLECLRLIRADERSAAIPVIMYSGDFTHARMQEAKRHGAQEYVVKGALRWSDFLEMIRHHIGLTSPPVLA